MLRLGALQLYYNKYIKYSMTKCLNFIYFGKCANSVQLHQIWYQFLFHLKETFLCDAEIKPAGERKG